MLALAVLPDFAAFQVLVLASLALAGPALFFYVRRLGADPVSAYCAGLFYALGPYLVGHLDDTIEQIRRTIGLLRDAIEDHEAAVRRHQRGA